MCDGASQDLLTRLCQSWQFFECLHEIHMCYLEKLKEQELEEKCYDLFCFCLFVFLFVIGDPAHDLAFTRQALLPLS